MICTFCKDQIHARCESVSCTCQHGGNARVLTNRERTDLAVYGVVLPREASPTSPVMQIRPDGCQ